MYDPEDMFSDSDDEKSEKKEEKVCFFKDLTVKLAG